MKRSLVVLACATMLMFGVTGCGNKEVKEETQSREDYTFEMESVSPTENFSLKDIDEINSGLVRVNKKLNAKGIDAGVESKVYGIEYGRDLKANVKDVTVTYTNGLRLTYRDNKLVQAYGKKEDVASLIDDEELLDYLYKAAEQGIFSYVSGDTIWYMYDGKYESSLLDTKCYVFVIDSHESTEGEYITIGLENSNIELASKNIKDDEVVKKVSKIYDTLDKITDNEELTDSNVVVQYDDISGSVNYMNYNDFYYPNIDEIEVDETSDVETMFKNEPELNMENGFTVENGFTLDENGYIVGDLPYGFYYGNYEEDEEDTNGAEIYDYIVSEARIEQAEEENYQNKVDKQHDMIAENVIEYISISQSDVNVTCALNDSNKKEVEELKNKLEELGSLTVVSETEQSITFNVYLFSE